jgi:hypothetical protein
MVMTTLSAGAAVEILEEDRVGETACLGWGR